VHTQGGSSVSGTLVERAEKHEIPHAVDIYPLYGSAPEATLRAGYDVALAVYVLR
jgi:putative aminopeptidase FrvX